MRKISSQAAMAGLAVRRTYAHADTIIDGTFDSIVSGGKPTS